MEHGRADNIELQRRRGHHPAEASRSGSDAAAEGRRHRSQQPSAGAPSGTPSGDAEDEGAMAALVMATERDYSRSRWTMLFADAAVEAEYVRFMYVDGGAYGPKMYAFSMASIWVLVMLWFHHPDPAPSVAAHTWYEGVWLLTGISIGINLITFGLFFVPALAEYREWIFFALLATHWPAFASGAMLEWHQESAGRMPLVYVTACLPFCVLVPLARFVYTSATVCILNTATFAIVSFAGKGGAYFESHSYFEIWIWVLTFFTMALLPVFERRSRDAFVETRRAQAAIALVEHQVASMRFAVAALFPPTPTLLALAQRRRARGDPRHDATGDADAALVPLVSTQAAPTPRSLGPGAFVLTDTCMVQTDIAGFTAFASKASMAEVIGTVGQVFAVMDAAAAAHGVEKVHTVGDCFVGAVFAPSPAAASALAADGAGGARTIPELPLAQRALAMLQFALIAKDATAHDSKVRTISRGTSLKIRVGVHVGPVVAALVGSAPPKCDLFDLPAAAEEAGDGGGTGTVTHTAHLEATGRPGYVHASTAFLAALAPVATAPLDDDEDDEDDDRDTPFGLQLRTINMRLTAEDEDDCFDTASDRGGPLQSHQAAHGTTAAGGEAELAAKNHHQGYEPHEPPRGRYYHHEQHASASEAAAAGAVVALMEDLVAANAADVADMLIERTTGNASSGEEQQQRRQRGVTHASASAANELDAADDDDGNDEDAADLTSLNIFKLRFKNEDTEAAYVEWVRGTSVLPEAQTVQLLRSVVYLVAEIGLAPCPANATDRGHMVLTASGLLLVSAIVHGRLLEPRHYMVIPVIYVLIAVTAAVMLSTTCLPTTNGADDEHSGFVRYQRTYIGTIVFFWFIQGAMALPLCVDQPMLLRVALLAFIALVVAPSSFLLRDVVVGDGALALHAVFPALLLAYMTASYFADLSLRRGFAATMGMRALLTSQRGKLAATVAKAADVMLPPFVNRAIAQAKARSDAEAANRTGGDGRRQQRDDDEEVGLLGADQSNLSPRASDPSTTGDAPSSPASASFMERSTVTSNSQAATTPTTNARDATKESMNVALEAASAVAAHRWHFDFPLPVCFVTFDAVAAATTTTTTSGGGGTACDGGGGGFHEVALVALAEAAAKRCNEAQGLRGGVGVHKVKSIGRRVLFVAGLEAATRHADAKGECARPPGQHTLGDAVAALVDVALDLVASARSPSGAVAEAVGGPGRVVVTAGVHCGPCFGAVLGLKRAVFDVFGDGVNTASRMESTAARGSVQLSEAAAQVAAERSAVSGRRRGSAAVGTGWDVEPAGTVEAKGKGTMPRFVVTATRSGGSNNNAAVRTV